MCFACILHVVETETVMKMHETDPVLLTGRVRFNVFTCFDPSPPAKPHYHKPVINAHTNLAKTKSWQTALANC